MNGRSNGGIDRETVTEFLRNLTLRERVELFNEVLSEFQELEVAEDGTVLFKTAYLVAYLTYANRKKESPPFGADVWALALPKTYEGVYVSDKVTQDGACDFCGLGLSGFTTWSICPACGSDVGMT